MIMCTEEINILSIIQNVSLTDSFIFMTIFASSAVGIKVFFRVYYDKIWSHIHDENLLSHHISKINFFGCYWNYINKPN